ncbi:aspartyl protease family protein [Alteromonas sp. NFXS44]|uniref:aspartyl protease family protein n=1 Tax=Alteromonas sp. NFXS44 TaxID=2818435 RepID=UPI0032DE5540
MKCIILWVAGMLFTTAVVASEQAVQHDQSAGGTLYLEATLESAVTATFLLDTGSGLLTLNKATFEALTKGRKLKQTGKSAARLANGKILTVSQYQLSSIRIGQACELGPVEVAVMPGGNNILGINTLLKAAPMTITAESVTLSGCR